MTCQNSLATETYVSTVGTSFLALARALVTQASHPSRWSRRSSINALTGVILAAMILVTIWNLTRSDRLEKARRFYARGELELCLQNALDHFERQPWSHEAALLAARCLSRLDYAELAEPYFERAGRLTLNDQQIRAYGLARSSKPERALPVYDRILDHSPDNVIALRRLAAVALSHTNNAELLKLAELFAGKARGASIGHMLRGVVYHRQNASRQAVACFERVLELDSKLRDMPLSHRLFWTYLAEDLVATGRLDDARRILSSAVADRPDADLMNRLGKVYLLKSEFEEAERCFRQAAARDPIDYNSYLNLSKLASKRHQRDAALKYLNQARRLAPPDESALSGLASSYRELGRAAEAARIEEAMTRRRDTSAYDFPLENSPWPRRAL